jgi:hypothetical protein
LVAVQLEPFQLKLDAVATLGLVPPNTKPAVCIPAAPPPSLTAGKEVDAVHDVPFQDSVKALTKVGASTFPPAIIPAV